MVMQQTPRAAPKPRNNGSTARDDDASWAVEEFTTDHWISVQEQPRRLVF